MCSVGGVKEAAGEAKGPVWEAVIRLVAADVTAVLGAWIDTKIAQMSAGVFIACALYPSLHLTRNLPERCHAYLKPSLLNVFFSDR